MRKLWPVFVIFILLPAVWQTEASAGPLRRIIMIRTLMETQKTDSTQTQPNGQSQPAGDTQKGANSTNNRGILRSSHFFHQEQSTETSSSKPGTNATSTTNKSTTQSSNTTNQPIKLPTPNGNAPPSNAP